MYTGLDRGFILKYRSAVSILIAILETIDTQETANITQISVTANISYSRLREKLKELTEAGIIEVANPRQDGGRNYALTEKGRKALIKLRELVSFLGSLGLISKKDS